MSGQALPGLKETKFVVITPVWGKTHIEIFLEICIPSLLVPNNLPAFAENCQIEYLIYTDEADLDILQNSTAIAKLRQYANVVIHIIPKLTDNKHHKMSQCHKYGIEYAAKNNAYLFFIPPDVIWANSSLRSLRQLVNSGYDVIHIAGLRVTYETFVPEILKSVQEDGTINIKSGSLVSLAIQHLHNITYKHFYEEHHDKGGLMPSNLIWSVRDQGILAHCFHLLPIITKPDLEHIDFGDTIDGDMLLSFENKKEYFVKDSDEFLLFEISPHSYDTDVPGKKSSIDVAALWSTNRVNSKHLEQIKHNIRMHTDAIDESVWQKAEQHAETIVNAILKRRLEFLGQYRFVTPIWGAKNLDLYLKYCLPSLLSHNNIKAFIDLNDPVYYIYTDKACEKIMQQDPSFAKLKSLMRVELILDPSYAGEVDKCYRTQVNKPSFKKTYIIPIAPNSIWADGTLQAIQEMNIYDVTDAQIDMVSLPIEKIADVLKTYITADKSLEISVNQLLTIASVNKLYPQGVYTPLSILNPEKYKSYKTNGLGLSVYTKDSSIFVDAASRNVQVCFLTENKFNLWKTIYLRANMLLSKSKRRTINLINRIENRICKNFAS